MTPQSRLPRMERSTKSASVTKETGPARMCLQSVPLRTAQIVRTHECIKARARCALIWNQSLCSREYRLCDVTCQAGLAAVRLHSTSSPVWTARQPPSLKLAKQPVYFVSEHVNPPTAFTQASDPTCNSCAPCKTNNHNC